MLINHTKLTDIATGIMAAAGAPKDKAQCKAAITFSLVPS